MNVLRIKIGRFRANGHLQDMCLVYSRNCIWHYDTDECGVESLFKRNGTISIYFKINDTDDAAHAIPRFV